MCEIESSIPHVRRTETVENLEFVKIEASLLKSKIVVLFGPPGIGKTSHAVECAYKTKEKDFNVQWFNSETKEKFNSDLISLNKFQIKDNTSMSFQPNNFSLKIPYQNFSKNSTRSNNNIFLMNK